MNYAKYDRDNDFPSTLHLASCEVKAGDIIYLYDRFHPEGNINIHSYVFAGEVNHSSVSIIDSRIFPLLAPKKINIVLYDEQMYLYEWYGRVFSIENKIYESFEGDNYEIRVAKHHSEVKEGCIRFKSSEGNFMYKCIKPTTSESEYYIGPEGMKFSVQDYHNDRNERDFCLVSHEIISMFPDASLGFPRINSITSY